MKHLRGLIVYPDVLGWSISIGAENSPERESIGAAGASPAQCATLIAAKIHSLGFQSADVIIAIAPENCLCATIATAGMPHRGLRSAMLYRLEEKLPAAAEDLAVDFVPLEKQALGIGALRVWLDPIAQALQAQKINVSTVCPAAFLAMQGARRLLRDTAALSSDLLLWQDGPQLHLFALSAGLPAAWLAFPAEWEDLVLALAGQVLTKRSRLRLALLNLDPALALRISSLPDIEITFQESLAIAIAIAVASRHIAGGASPFVDLRCIDGVSTSFKNQQLRAPIIAASAAILLLGLCISTSLLWRASRYSGLAENAQIEKAALFHRVFPGQPVPIGMQSRLKGVEGQLRQDHPGSVVAAGTDALVSLHELLAHLPADVRYSISEVDLDPGRITVQGQTISHGDAGAVAGSLRQSTHFFIEDPQTQQLSAGTVQFSITGPLKAAAGMNAQRRNE